MRQAIVTKYLGPTDHRGSRIKATCDAKTLTFPWCDALGLSENHEKAATALAWSLGWLDNNPRPMRLVGGGMPQSTPYAYCFVMVAK